MDNITTATLATAQGGIRITCDGEKMMVITGNVTPAWKNMSYNDSTGIMEATTSLIGGASEAISSTSNMGLISDNISIPPREVANLILYSIVLFLAVVGNVLVIVTLIVNKRMRTVTGCFLLTLSVSDLLLASICMPISLTGRILKKFIFGRVMCKVMPFLMGASVSISTFTMSAISVERYYAICRPFKSLAWQTVSHAYKVIVGIWLFCCCLGFPYLLLSDLRYIPLLKYRRCSLACRLNFQSPQATRAWYVLLLVILFCIPGILMTVAYTLVSCKIRKDFQVKSRNPNGDCIPDEDHDRSDGLYIAPKRAKKSFRRVRNSLRRLVSHHEPPSTDALPSTSDTAQKTVSCLFKVQTKRMPISSAEIRNSHKQKDAEMLEKENSFRRSRVESRSFRTAKQLNANKKVIRMLIVIVSLLTRLNQPLKRSELKGEETKQDERILFFVCWTPLFIVNVWRAFDPSTAMKKLDGIIEVIQLMSYVSTCVNPLVYCFMNQQFRTGFLHAFLFCIPRFRKRPNRIRRRGMSLH